MESDLFRQIGVEKSELIDMVVAKIVTQIFDPEDYEDTGMRSELQKGFQSTMTALVDKKVSAIADEHLAPQISKEIEDIVFQKTNSWGEKNGDPYTIRDYITGLCRSYMSEGVDCNGKTKEQSNSSYFRSNQGRLAYMIDKHLHYSVETAMKEALSLGVEGVKTTLLSTCKDQLRMMTESIKVAVTIK